MAATDISGFTLTFRLDASLQVNSGSSGSMRDWVKPGVEASVSFSDIPSDKEIEVATEFIQSRVIEPIMGEIIASAHQKLSEINEGL